MGISNFYPVTPEVSKKLRQGKLTAAEWKIWSYLIEVDPWGDNYRDINTLTVMTECEVSKATYYRALAKFQELGLFDFQDKGISVRNLAGVSSLKNETGFSEMRQDSQKREKILKNETGFSEMRQDSQNCEKPPLEPLPAKDSSSPQTLQTYKDFTDSLSDTERESFENFVKEEWRKLTSRNKEAGQEIISLERFLTRKEDFQNWYTKFLESPVGKAAQKRNLAALCNWRNDPRFTEWIWEAFNRGYEWVEENIAEREQRSAFHDWAFEVNAFEGVCYSYD